MIDPDIAIESAGWVAVGLTFLTYSQKTMLPLRICGIGANMCFILWALGTGVMQPLILHACLLPLNTLRLYQILRMKREAEAAQKGQVFPLDWLRPHVKPMRFAGGDLVFRKGDAPDHLYYLVQGSVVFDEVSGRAAPGEVFGEVAFLTSQRARTASARCEGPCEVLALDATDLAKISLQHPSFNFYILQVLAARLGGAPVPQHAPATPFDAP